MQAIVYHQYGPADVLQPAQVEKPAPKDDQVLIKVYASTASSSDCNIRGFTFVPRGFGLISRLVFGYSKPRKTILGLEVAGEIEAVGQAVTSFKPGDAVFGIDGAGLGAYAEYKCMPAGAGLALKPANLSYAQAAAIPNGALTALTLLRDLTHISHEHKLLIIGASGSIGSAAVQIAKYYGAHVTGVCSQANLALVQSLGADEVIDYAREDFTRRTAAFDIIFDTVGKSSFSACKKALAPKGIYLTAAGKLPEFGQMLWTSLTGGKKVIAGASSERQEDLLFIKQLVEAGALKPVIDRCYPLAQTAEAHRYVDQGHKKGNVVIIVRQASAV